MTLLEDHVGECERKIEALERRVRKLELRLAATIEIAFRDATSAVIERLRAALEEGT